LKARDGFVVMAAHIYLSKRVVDDEVSDELDLECVGMAN
jgi:hypothetical protein